MRAFGQQLPKTFGPFLIKQAGAVVYRQLDAPLVPAMKGALVGWKIRSVEKFGDTEVATATPYLESKGASDPGDAYKWTDVRATAGKGIIIEPPDDWTAFMSDPAQVLMHMRVGQLQIIATDDYNWLGRAAETIEGIVWIAPPRGFVLCEPKGGWKNVTAAPPEPSKPEPHDATAGYDSWLFGAGVILAATGVVMLWVDR